MFVCWTLRRGFRSRFKGEISGWRYICEYLEEYIGVFKSDGLDLPAGVKPHWGSQIGGLAVDPPPSGRGKPANAVYGHYLLGYRG